MLKSQLISYRLAFQTEPTAEAALRLGRAGMGSQASWVQALPLQLATWRVTENLGASVSPSVK